MKIPGFRGVVTLFFDGIVSMVSPYPKAWKIRVRRTVGGWDGNVFPHPSLATIELTAGGQSVESAEFPRTDRTIKAMNPAHIIYECLTNRPWGRGMSRLRIDDTSFSEAALTLFNEGFGLCLKWSRTDTIESFIQSILDTIGASLYPDRQTGLLRLKLMRGDYQFNQLPVFDANSGLLEITEAAVGSPTNLISEVIVQYHDPVTDKPRKVRVQNLATIQAFAGATNAQTKEYKGVPTSGLATRLAQRDLRIGSTRLRRFAITLDRRGWDIYPGDVIRVRDLSRKIPDMALRVATYSDASMSGGQIKITAVQDVFALPATSFVSTQGSQWVPPKNEPCIGRHRVVEMPYASTVRALKPADFNALTGEHAMFAALCEEGQVMNTSYAVMLRNGLPSAADDAVDQSYFCGYTAP